MACAQVCGKLPLPLASPVGYTHPKLRTPGGGAAASALERMRVAYSWNWKSGGLKVGPSQPSGNTTEGNSLKAE